MERTPTWARVLIIVQAALVLVFFAVAAEKSASSAQLMETAQTVCGDAMVAIEMDLRNGDPVQAEDVDAFYTITRLYEDSPQAMLAECFYRWKLQRYIGMDQARRYAIADGIMAFYSDDATSEELKAHYEHIMNILAEGFTWY